MQQGVITTRKTSLMNMWIIIFTMLGCSLFDFCYSLAIFFLYTPECTPARIPFCLDSTFKFLDRFIAYYLWLYPLLWMFWPTKKNLDARKKYTKTMRYLYGSITGSSGRSTKTKNMLMNSNTQYNGLYDSSMLLT